MLNLTVMLFKKISAFQNGEFKIMAAFKILAFQNPEFKNLADFKT